jgi:thioredoxin
MRKIILTSTVLLAAVFGIFAVNTGGAINGSGKAVAITEPAKDAAVISLTYDSFKKLIFDYEKNKEWKYEGSKPAIIDFYADWCAPCRQLSPLVEQVAKEYAGKINVYKVDTQKEQKLAESQGIQSLPTLLFIPVNGKPQASLGAIPRETLVQAINDVLLVK